MPTAEVKGCLVSVYHLAHKSAKLSWSSLLLRAIANKATSPDPSVWLCSVSLTISVFFTHSLHDVLARTRDSSKVPRPYSLCPKVSNTNGKLLSPNHQRSLPAAPHSDLSARQYKGLFQDMMFERLHDSTFSEDASEVIVQPLPCGTEKANSVARVIVKHTPRLCNRCASNT